MACRCEYELAIAAIVVAFACILIWWFGKSWQSRESDSKKLLHAELEKAKEELADANAKAKEELAMANDETQQAQEAFEKATSEKLEAEKACEKLELEKNTLEADLDKARTLLDEACDSMMSLSNSITQLYPDAVGHLNVQELEDFVERISSFTMTPARQNSPGAPLVSTTSRHLSKSLRLQWKLVMDVLDKWLPTVMHLVHIFFLSTLLIFVMAVFSGALMQFVFLVFYPLETSDTWYYAAVKIVEFLITPVLMVCLALFLHVSYRNVIDSFKYPAVYRGRSLMLAASKTFMDNPSLAVNMKLWCRRIDVFFVHCPFVCVFLDIVFQIGKLSEISFIFKLLLEGGCVATLIKFVHILHTETTREVRITSLTRSQRAKSTKVHGEILTLTTDSMELDISENGIVLAVSPDSSDIKIGWLIDRVGYSGKEEPWSAKSWSDAGQYVDRELHLTFVTNRVNIWLLYLLGILCSALILSFSLNIPELAWYSLISGGVTWAFFTSILVLSADIVVSYSHDTKLHNRICLTRVRFERTEHGLMSGKLGFSVIWLVWKKVMDEEPHLARSVSSNRALSMPRLQKSWLKRATIVLWVLVVPIAGFAVNTTELPFLILVAPTFLGVVLLLSTELVHWLPSVKRNNQVSYYTFLLFFSVFLLVGCILGQFQDALFPPRNESMIERSQPGVAQLSPTPYTACRVRWGSQTSNLSVLDLAALSSYAYVENRSYYSKQLNDTFGPRAKIVNFTSYMTIPRVFVTSFDNDALVVVSIKGTSNAVDFFTDASFYSMLAMLQSLSWYVDLVDFLPKTLISDVMASSHAPFLSDKSILQTVNDSYQVAKKKYRNATFVFTGHSLGGGIAAALGAYYHEQTVVFSAPGTHFSRKRLGLESYAQDEAYRNVLNIVPDHDMVPHVDKQDATVQKIVCAKHQGGRLRLLDAVGCHMPWQTLCELWRGCGDTEGRNFPRCKSGDEQATYWNETDMFRYLQSTMWNIRWLDRRPEE